MQMHHINPALMNSTLTSTLSTNYSLLLTSTKLVASAYNDYWKLSVPQNVTRGLKKGREHCKSQR